MRIKNQLQLNSYINYLHSLSEPNEVIIMGKQKRDKELPGFMHKVGHLTGKELDEIQEQNNRAQDAYVASKNKS